METVCEVSVSVHASPHSSYCPESAFSRAARHGQEAVSAATVEGAIVWGSPFRLLDEGCEWDVCGAFAPASLVYVGIPERPPSLLFLAKRPKPDRVCTGPLRRRRPNLSPCAQWGSRAALWATSMITGAPQPWQTSAPPAKQTASPSILGRAVRWLPAAVLSFLCLSSVACTHARAAADDARGLAFWV